MLFAYRLDAGKLTRLAVDADLEQAIWIDLYKPLPAQAERATALGIDVPTLADMEEIEISNRLYRDPTGDYMTVVLPGHSETKEPLSGPVTFILTPQRLFTVRHHAPRPFETFPERADKGGAGCDTPEKLFLGLLEEIVGRLADLLEGSGRGLETAYRTVYHPDDQAQAPERLQSALQEIGKQSEVIARVRLALLTLERAIGFNVLTQGEKKSNPVQKAIAKGLQRDVSALEIHCDYLATRVAQATDTTLGMINLVQNGTVRIVSVVTVLFMPPTLIASIYGMNFHAMPELSQTWGYPVALGLMLLSAAGTFLFFRWKKWL
ncbi:MAG: magnesium transporter CorA family protein [bacterium]